MYTHYLFTIPKGIPYLPEEIWINIFFYKWRLELKDVLKELPPKKNTDFIGDNKMGTRRKTGNFWFKYIIDKGWKRGIEVKEKSGIEILNWKSVLLNIESPISFPILYNQESFSRHIKENLNIECDKNFPWDQLFRLSRKV